MTSLQISRLKVIRHLPTKFQAEYKYMYCAVHSIPIDHNEFQINLLESFLQRWMEVRNVVQVHQITSTQLQRGTAGSFQMAE